MQKRHLLVVSLVALLSLVATGFAAEEAAKKTPWKLTGVLEEACNCNAACPCWFNSMPSKMQCGGGQVVFIEKGHYGKVKLDGLSMAALGQSPHGQTMMESFGNWDFGYMYIDEKATPEQRDALKVIGTTIFGEPSKNSELRFVPITRVVEGKEHKIALGKYGSFQGHLIEGGLGGAPKIVNPPGADPLHHEYLQGETSQLVYNDAGQNWDTKNSNYMQGSFTVDSEQYEKYAAGLAKKMAEAQKSKADTK